MSRPSIEIEQLSAAYGGGARRTMALKDITLAVETGEIFGLPCPNGAGKSTLLACIEGLHQAEHGTVRVVNPPLAEEAPPSPILPTQDRREGGRGVRLRRQAAPECVPAIQTVSSRRKVALQISNPPIFL
jgi:ABC-type cobalamin/Fe3+-siderophores transport system ATPase subunit